MTAVDAHPLDRRARVAVARPPAARMVAVYEPVDGDPLPWTLADAAAAVLASGGVAGALVFATGPGPTPVIHAEIEAGAGGDRWSQTVHAALQAAGARGGPPRPAAP